MGEFFRGWRRDALLGALVFAFVDSSGCAKSLSTNTPAPPATAKAKTGIYQVDFKNANGASFSSQGRKLEYRLNDAMLSISDGKLSVDGKLLATLNESDIVTVEDSRTIAVNGVLVWPDTSE